MESADSVRQKREEVLRRYQEFKESAKQRRQKLEEAKKLQQFCRNAEELETWINEKMQIATDDSYKDPTNIQVCVATKHLQGLNVKLDTSLKIQRHFHVL